MWRLVVTRRHALCRDEIFLLSVLERVGIVPSQVLDAAIYLTQAVSEYVDPDEETYVPAILSLLPRLPSHPFVSQAALLMVGEWWRNLPTYSAPTFTLFGLEAGFSSQAACYRELKSLSTTVLCVRLYCFHMGIGVSAKELSPGQTVLPTRANSGQVTKSKLASAGGQTIPPSRASSPEAIQLSEYDGIVTYNNKTTWFEMAWVDWGGQRVVNLARVGWKFELDQIQANSSQLKPSGWPTIPNSIEVGNLARVGLSWEDRVARAIDIL